MTSLDPSPSRIPPSSLDALTDRQRQCLRLAAGGLTSFAIGERIGVSSRTVDEHLMSACNALGVRTRIQAVARLAAEARRADESRNFLP